MGSGPGVVKPDKAAHPGRASWTQAVTPPRPPQSEQPGRGVNAPVPFREQEYQEIGNTGTYRTSDRMMTVGIMTQAQAAARQPPQSEQPGRGIFASPQFDQFGGGEFSGLEQPQQVSNFGPVGDFINRVRPREIA
jgi:hypothetical protein